MNQPPIVAANAVFVFCQPVNEKSVADFTINLINFSRDNPKQPLRVNINSVGGNFGDALALYEEFGRLRANGHHLTLACYGRCASCTSWWLQAADHRVIGANSWLLIHQIISSVSGNIRAFKRELARMEELMEQSIGFLCSRSNLTQEKIRQMCDGGEDWWIGAQEALMLGLVDAIEEAPQFPKSAPVVAA